MKLYIRGEGQLAQATRICCAKHFEVPNYATRLLVITEPPDVLWVAHDTPVNSLDESNVGAILDDVRPIIAALPDSTLILISSQLPVGTTAILEGEFPAKHFACSPENIRVAHGVSDFENQARVVVGTRPTLPASERLKLTNLFTPFTQQIVWVGTETAECVKHCLNAFMAVSIAFINEVDTICGIVGADSAEVARCVKMDSRVGEKARLNPGAPYSGGTLARDVFTLAKLGGDKTPLISSIKRSNDRPR